MECNKCERTFSTKRSLARHVGNRRSPCCVPKHRCTTCGKGLASYQTLWKHKKRCQAKQTEFDDSASVLSMGSLDKVVNKSELSSPPPSKRAKQQQQQDRSDIIDCVESITPIKVLGVDDDDDDTSVKDEPDDESDKSFKDDGEEIEKELEVEEVLSQFIKTRIEEPRKRLMELLRNLKITGARDDRYVARLEQLIDDFLRGKKKVSKDIEDTFRALKTTSNTVEMEIMLKNIEDINSRFTNIFRCLNKAEHEDIPSILKALSREQQISYKAYEKLIENDTAHSLPSIVKVLKEHPHRKDDAVFNGYGCVIYLPGTTVRLQEKLCVLLGEYQAGNTITRNEIVAILNRLRERDAISEEEYMECNNFL